LNPPQTALLFGIGGLALGLVAGLASLSETSATNPLPRRKRIGVNPLAPYCPSHSFSSLTDWRARNAYVKRYAWAIPSEEALAEIAKYGPIVEIGAGKGYWAHLLRERGVHVEAFDLHPPTKTWTQVRKGSTREVSDYPDHTLFLCWPPYAEPMGYDALMAYHGEHVIYIGEGSYGCTGDDAFHEELKANWARVKIVDIPQWDGIHDYMDIYRRKVSA